MIIKIDIKIIFFLNCVIVNFNHEIIKFNLHSLITGVKVFRQRDLRIEKSWIESLNTFFVIVKLCN